MVLIFSKKFSTKSLFFSFSFSFIYEQVFVKNYISVLKSNRIIMRTVRQHTLSVENSKQICYSILNQRIYDPQCFSNLDE